MTRKCDACLAGVLVYRAERWPLLARRGAPRLAPPRQGAPNPHPYPTPNPDSRVDSLRRKEGEVLTPLMGLALP